VARALDHLETVAGDALRAGPIAGFFTEAVETLRPLAVEALQADVEPLGATYVVKAARTGVPTLWHQDSYGWRELGITAAVSIGVALDRSTRENGCLLAIPGSHRLATHPLHPVSDPPNLFRQSMDATLVDASRAVAVELEPGDASIHHPNLVHGAEPNTSPRPRRTLVVRYRAA
jgi:phytanoyl-CoA hydroxylase